MYKEYFTISQSMEKEEWTQFIKEEFNQEVIKFHTYDQESIVVESAQHFFKILKKIKDNLELEINKLLFKNPHENILSPTNICFVNNLGKEYAVIVMEKLYDIHECYDFFERDLQLQLCNQLDEAVCHIHSLGYYHGDLKPQNICISKNDKIKIIDFGASNLINKPEFTNSFGFCSPSQLSYWLETMSYKSQQKYINILKKLKKLKIIKCEDEKIVVNESSIVSDLFVVGLLMVYIYGRGLLLFLPNQKNKDFESEIINNYDKFLEDPKGYINVVYDKIKPPKKIRDKITKYLLDGVYNSDGNGFNNEEN